MQPKLPYACDKAFAPVILIGRGPNVLVVRADSPYKTRQGHHRRSEGETGQAHLRVTRQLGTSAHLAGEMFTNLAKVRDDPRAVPGRRPGDHRHARRAGRHDLRHGRCRRQPSSSSGKLRAIAVTSPARSPAHARTSPRSPSGPRLRGRELVRPLSRRRARRRTSSRSSTQRSPRRPRKSDEFRKRIEPEGLVISAGEPAELDALRSRRGGPLAKGRQGKQHQAGMSTDRSRT